MISYNLQSFEYMKDQLEKTRLEIARNRLADTMDQAHGHPNVFRALATRAGRRLARLGSWLEQLGRPVKPIGS